MYMELTDCAVFTCGECGASAPSFGIEYDILGYPICPDCGTVDSPLTAPQTDSVRPAPTETARSSR